MDDKFPDARDNLASVYTVRSVPTACAADGHLYHSVLLSWTDWLVPRDEGKATRGIDFGRNRFWYGMWRASWASASNTSDDLPYDFKGDICQREKTTRHGSRISLVIIFHFLAKCGAKPEIASPGLESPDRPKSSLLGFWPTTSQAMGNIR
jgi:hypothetical protein